MTEKVDFYLILYKRDKYSTPTARITKNTPALKRNEISIKMSVSVPRALFETPQLQANITLPDDRLAPEVFNLDVRQNLEDIIKQHAGFEVKLIELPVEEQ